MIIKDNINIMGFECMEDISATMAFWRNHPFRTTIMYFGKTSEISEESAKECVRNWRTDGLYNNYLMEPQYEECMFKTAKESIQSACQDEYCIIYKIESIFKKTNELY